MPKQIQPKKRGRPKKGPNEEWSQFTVKLPARTRLALDDWFKETGQYKYDTLSDFIRSLIHGVVFDEVSDDIITLDDIRLVIREELGAFYSKK